MRKRRFRSALASTFALGLGALAGCSTAVNDDSGPSSTDAVIAGTEDRADPAVFYLVAANGYQCSAFLVSPTVVMTAGHCVHPKNAGNKPTFEIFTGWNLSSGRTGRHIKITQPAHSLPAFDVDHVDRGSDLAFLTLNEAIPDSEIKPLPVSSATLSNDFIGAAVRVVGFGALSIDDEGNPNGVGVRRTATVHVGAATPAWYSLVTAKNGGRTCVGDSGGAVIQSLNGVDTVVGMVSFGDEQCDTLAAAARLDRNPDFMSQNLPPPPVPVATDDMGPTPDLGEPTPDLGEPTPDLGKPMPTEPASP